MGVLPQALEIIFEVQKNQYWKNNNKKNKLFKLQNMFFSFFFFSLDPSYFQTS
jgi:hypothetical protein